MKTIPPGLLKGAVAKLTREWLTKALRAEDK
jgi:hypothetical protein